MATLDAKKRADLPDSAFAYVDSKGERRLPINDESHVRNALSRFNQVKFESRAAREKAFRRLLTAATGYGIAPVGFVTRQLREARSEGEVDLPTGPVTLLMTDIEGSTMLVHDLADRYLRLLDDVRSLIRSTVGDHDGYEVDSRADEYFAAFGRAEDAIGAAVEIQKRMSESTWPDDRRVRVRIGVHSGSPALTDTGYVGMPVNVMARVCAAGHGGQILMTAATRDELAHWPRDIDAVSLGVFEIRGLPEPEELLQVRGPGLSDDFPRLRVGHSDSQD